MKKTKISLLTSGENFYPYSVIYLHTYFILAKVKVDQGPIWGTLDLRLDYTQNWTVGTKFGTKSQFSFNFQHPCVCVLEV